MSAERICTIFVLKKEEHSHLNKLFQITCSTCYSGSANIKCFTEIAKKLLIDELNRHIVYKDHITLASIIHQQCYPVVFGPEGIPNSHDSCSCYQFSKMPKAFLIQAERNETLQTHSCSYSPQIYHLTFFN